MNALLAPLELLYRGIGRARRAMYRRGVLRAETLPRPVVSIGNRTMGGSGKTPAVITIARGLMERGLRPAILTRGYGRTAVEQPLLVDSADAARFGDEPVLLHQALPELDVVVGSKRAAAGRWYLQRGECDLFLLDDGFQHLQLAREVDIVIEHAGARWQREGVSALADADIVIVREEHSLSPVPGRFGGTLRPAGWLVGGGRAPLESLRGRSAVAFAGLADNEQFFSMLRSLGLDLRATRGFRDHHRWSSSDLPELEELRVRTDASILVTTAKDAVRIDRGAVVLDLAILEVELTIEPAEAFFDLLIGRLALENMERG